jgi:rubrerythrin
MKEEQTRVIEALRVALQMELDGKQFYLTASREAGDRLGKELFEWLAGEEDKHRQRFEQIYEALRKNEGWPVVEVKPEAGKGWTSLFRGAIERGKTGDNSKELDAAVKAMEMEEKTRKYYESQSREPLPEVARKFYSALAEEERGHYLALVEYREYLIDPAGWFRKAEHHSLDGG